LTLPIKVVPFFYQYITNILFAFPLSTTLHFAPTSVFLFPTHKKSAADALNSLTSFQAKVLPLPFKSLYVTARKANAPVPSILFLAMKALEPT
jgi:hypothetical protein